MSWLSYIVVYSLSESFGSLCRSPWSIDIQLCYVLIVACFVKFSELNFDVSGSPERCYP